MAITIVFETNTEDAKKITILGVAYGLFVA